MVPKCSLQKLQNIVLLMRNVSRREGSVGSCLEYNIDDKVDHTGDRVNFITCAPFADMFIYCSDETLKIL